MGISFIIPAFNAEQYVTECVDSIMSLRLADFEIWVVDDGSTDATSLVVETQLKRWNSERKYVNLLQQRNAGVSVARNVALAQSTKEWVTFVDADDLIMPMFKEALLLIEQHGENTDVFVFDLHLSANREVGIITTHKKDLSLEIFGQEKRLLLMKNTLGFVSNEEKLNYRFPNSLGKVYNKKRVIDAHKLSFPIGVKNGEDLLFNLQVWESVQRVIASHIPVYLYYNNMSSLTHRFKPDIKEITYRFFDNLLPIVERYPILWAQYHNSMVRNFFIECNQFLFHIQNQMCFADRWHYFHSMCRGDYHDSFVFEAIVVPKDILGKSTFFFLRNGFYFVAFLLFYLKYILKCILKK
ncbi:glycosyltransferase family 2 protein [Phocaeicola sp.]